MKKRSWLASFFSQSLRYSAPNSNDRRQFVAVIAAFTLFVLTVAPVFAQAYNFSVSEMRLQTFIQPDASATLEYDITFANSSLGRPIDIVDIGTPHDNYDLSNMSASMNGVELTDIRPSEFVDPGVEIHLQGQTIPPGGQGTLHFEFVMPDMVFQDTTNDEFASFRISPTFFDKDFVAGSTDVWILVHMLPEITSEEMLFQNVPFTDKVIFEEHPVAVWRWPDGQATGPKLVGVSFPKRGMNRIIEQSTLELAIEWLEDNPGAHLVLGILAVGLFAVTFFRFSGGTGISVFVLLAVGLGWLLISRTGSILLVLPATTVLFGVNEWQLSRRKERYLPAIAQVEGGGIKRGLTAPEAAVILELPLNKILTLIIFGLMEKGVLRQVEDTPLKVEVSPEFQFVNLKAEKRKQRRLHIAEELGIVMRTYEHPFLDLIEEAGDKPVHENDFGQPMKVLIETTADRLKGFDLSDTQDYYRRIIRRALNEAKRIGEIPERERYIDRHLQWLLLDEEYPTIFPRRGYHYRPIWIRPFASSDRMGAPSIPSAGAQPGRTSLGDVAASFAGWTENTMGDLASSIAPGSLQIEGPGGIANLSGADKVTGDIFKSLASSSGGSSGGGGSCACACAGCACACACAGGGR